MSNSGKIGETKRKHHFSIGMRVNVILMRIHHWTEKSHPFIPSDESTPADHQQMMLPGWFISIIYLMNDASEESFILQVGASLGGWFDSEVYSDRWTLFKYIKVVWIDWMQVRWSVPSSSIGSSVLSLPNLIRMGIRIFCCLLLFGLIPAVCSLSSWFSRCCLSPSSLFWLSHPHFSLSCHRPLLNSSFFSFEWIQSKIHSFSTKIRWDHSLSWKTNCFVSHSIQFILACLWISCLDSPLDQISSSRMPPDEKGARHRESKRSEGSPLKQE